MMRLSRCLLGLFLLLTLGALPGCFFSYQGPAEPAAAPPVLTTGLPGHAEKVWTDAPTVIQTTALTSDTFIQLALQANPAVVNIFTAKSVKTAVGDPLGIFQFRTPNLDFQAKALGTGFFISSDGFLVTNAHVVAGMDEIKVYLWKESAVKSAQLIGLDTASDVALLKVEPDRPLPYLTLADSDAVRMGELVVAIGNPFGLEHSLTEGLISAKHRRFHRGAGAFYEDFLQTSAQINPGNSGGPLINLRGEVVGVNSAMVMGGQAIGFAVPSNLVKEVIPHLVRAGRVQRAYIGVRLVDLTPDLRSKAGEEGAMVDEVESGSPASAAGLEKGDIVLKINGKTVYDATGLARTLSLLVAGRPAELTVKRGAATKKITLTPVLAQENRSRQ